MTAVATPVATINPDDAPEAPSPRPTLVIFMRVTENGAAHDYEGGSVILSAIAGQDPALREVLNDGRLVLASSSNGFLETFPWKSRAAKQARHFKLTLEEVPFEQVPVDPMAVAAELYDGQGRRLNRNGTLMIPIQMKPATG